MTQVTTEWNELKQEAINRLRTSKELSGKDGALVPLIKDLLETALDSALTEHLKEEKTDNHRNGKTTIKSVLVCVMCLTKTVSRLCRT